MNNKGASGVAVAALIIAIIAAILVILIVIGFAISVDRSISFEKLIYKTIIGNESAVQNYIADGNTIFKNTITASDIQLTITKPSGQVTGQTFIINNTSSNSNINLIGDSITIIDNINNNGYLFYF